MYVCERERRVNPLSPLTLISLRAEPGSSGLTAAVSQTSDSQQGCRWGKGKARPRVMSTRLSCVCLSVHETCQAC